MSADEGQQQVQKHYLAAYDNILNQDYTEAYEISQRTGKDEKEIDLMLDALSRTTKLEKTSTGDEGRIYNSTNYDLEEHQNTIRRYDLL